MKKDYLKYMTNRITKMIVCIPIFLPLLVLGLFLDLLHYIGKKLISFTKKMDQITERWVESGSWLDKVSDWIHRP